MPCGGHVESLSAASQRKGTLEVHRDELLALLRRRRRPPEPAQPPGVYCCHPRPATMPRDLPLSNGTMLADAQPAAAHPLAGPAA